MTLADVITAEASRQGLTIRELAARSDLSHSRLHELMRGQTDPRWSAVTAVLAGLGRSLTWLDRQIKNPEFRTDEVASRPE